MRRKGRINWRDPEAVRAYYREYWRGYRKVLTPEQRQARNAAVLRWKAANPERWKELQRKSRERRGLIKGPRESLIKSQSPVVTA